MVQYCTVPKYPVQRSGTVLYCTVYSKYTGTVLVLYSSATVVLQYSSYSTVLVLCTVLYSTVYSTVVLYMLLILALL